MGEEGGKPIGVSKGTPNQNESFKEVLTDVTFSQTVQQWPPLRERNPWEDAPIGKTTFKVHTIWG